MSEEKFIPPADAVVEETFTPPADAIEEVQEPLKKKESTNLQSPAPLIPIPGKMSSSQLGLEETVLPSGVVQNTSLQPLVPVRKEKVSPKKGFDWSFDQASKDFQAETGVTPPAVSTVGKQSDALAIKKEEIADPNVSSQEKLKKIRTMSGVDQLTQYQGLIDQLAKQTSEESDVLQKQLIDQDAKLDEMTAVLSDEAMDQEQKAGMMDEYNALVESRNTGANEFNKRLDGAAKLMDAQVLNNHGHQILQKYADSEVGDGDVMLRSAYNAIVPATINGLGRSIQSMGILPMVPGAQQLEEAMGEDAISSIAGEYLANLGKSMEVEIPQDAQGSILKDFTLRKAANVAGQVVGSMASMLIPAGMIAKGGKTVAFAASTNQAMGTTYDSAKEAGLSDKEAAMMSSIVAPIIGVLDATGIESVLKNISRDELSKMIVKGAVKSLAGETTEKGIVDAVQLSFGETIAELAKTGGKVALEEGSTEALQDVVDKTSKVVVNKIKGEDTYGEQFGEEGLTSIAESFLVGSVAGGTLGSLTGGQSKKSVYENAVETGSSPERMEQFRGVMEMSVRNGVMTQEEADNTISNINAIVEADKVIPDNIKNVDERIEAVNLINERNRLVEKIEGKDPSLSLPTKQRIDGINARLTEISTGQKPDVSKGEGETKPQTAEEKAEEKQAKTPQIEPLIKDEVVEEKSVEKIVEKKDFSTANQDEIDVLTLEKQEGVIDEAGQKRLDELTATAELTVDKTIEDGKETEKTEVLNEVSGKENVDPGAEKQAEAEGGSVAPRPKDEKSDEGPVKSKRIVRKPANAKALSHEVDGARDLVLQHFVGGKKMKSSAVAEIFGRNKSGKIKGEGAIRSAMMNNTSGETVDGMAHKLWEQHGEDTGLSTSDFKDAIEQVIINHTSTASMVEELNNKYDKVDDGMSEEEKHYRSIYGDPETESGQLIDDMTDEEAQKLYDDMDTPEFEKAMDDLHDELEKEYAEQKKQSVRDAINKKFDKLNDLVDKISSFGISDEVKKMGAKGNSMVPLKSLLDTVRKLTLKAVDAGFTIEEAVQDALEKVKKLPMYKRLIDEGVIDDKIFTKEVTDQFVETKPGEVTEKKAEAKEKPVGEKKMKTAERNVEGEFIDEDIKKGLIEKGYSYVPSSKKITQKDAEAYVKNFADNGELDQAFNHVIDDQNDMDDLTRATVAREVAKAYSYLRNSETDLGKREEYLNKIVDVTMRAAEILNQSGKTVSIAGRLWAEMARSTPEGIVLAVKKHQNKVNDPYLKKYEKAIKDSYKDISDILNDPSVVEYMEKELTKRIEEIGEKNLGKDQRKKIGDFFDSLKIDTKGKMFDATVGLPIAVWNTAMETIKRGVYLGLTINEAIQKAITEVDKTEKNWDRKGFEATIKERFGQAKIVKKRDINKEAIMKKLDALKGLSDEKKKKIVAKIAKEIADTGVLTEKKYKDIVADAMGLEVLDAQGEASIYDLAKKIANATEKETAFHDVYKKQSTDPEPKDVFNTKKKKAKEEFTKAIDEAKQANDELSNYFKGEKEFLRTLATMMQGNLLTPLSLVKNLWGYTGVMPLRFISGSVSSGLDWLASNVLRNIGLKKQIQEGRTYNAIAQIKGGLKYGLWSGAKEGAKGLVRGQVSEDYTQRDVNQKIEPGKAWGELYDQISGKEKKSVEKMLTNIVEGTAGIPAEAMFRLLNLVDKPAREFAKAGRLYEIGQAKGLKGDALEEFVMFPDEESKADAEEVGKVASYQQENLAGKGITYVSQEFRKMMAKKYPKYSKYITGFTKLLTTTQMPFVKTPVNIEWETLQYLIPHIPFTAGVMSAASGNRRDAVKYFGRAITGASMHFVILGLLKNGLITAGLDKEEEEKEKQGQRDSQKGPNKINVSAIKRILGGAPPETKDGDVWVEYKYWGLPGMMMDALSGMHKHDKKEDLANAEIGKGFVDIEEIFGTIKGGAKAAIENSFLQGANTFLEAISGGEKETERWSINTIGALSSSIYPNTLAVVSKSNDKYIRELRNKDASFADKVADQFKNKMFMGDELPYKVSLWGEPITGLPEGRNDRLKFFLLDVTKASKVDVDDFRYKLAKMWDEQDDDTGRRAIFPAIPQPKVRIGDVSVDLTPKEHQQYMEAVGKQRKALVKVYVESQEFDNDDNDARLEKLKYAYDAGKDAGWGDFIFNNERMTKVYNGYGAEVYPE